MSTDDEIDDLIRHREEETIIRVCRVLAAIAAAGAVVILLMVAMSNNVPLGEIVAAGETPSRTVEEAVPDNMAQGNEEATQSAQPL